MWDGYFTLAGTEIMNGPRTEAYARNAGKYWLHPQYDKPEFHEFLDQTAYTDPVTDGAVWYDPDIPESADFYGLYPLGVDGIENSSRSSTVMEFTIDGGSPGRIRHGTKAVVFNGVLVGGSDLAVEYGARWLRRALLGPVCSDDLATRTSTGAELAYFAGEPNRSSLSEPATSSEVASLWRFLKKFVVNNGPTVTARRVMDNCGGGALLSVSFTGVAGLPGEYGLGRALLQGYLDPSVADPWAPGATAGAFDTVSTPFTEVACGVDTWEPIYDPLCAALVAPPTPPLIPLGCFTAPAAWDRYRVDVAPQNVPLWIEAVPVITVRAPAGAARVVTVTTTAASQVVTAPAATFSAADVGKSISAVGVPDGSTITIFTSDTQVTVSNAATASGTDTTAEIIEPGLESRNVRLRFYEDPTASMDPNADPCAFESDVVISYIPAGGSLIFDAVEQAVYVMTALGQRRRADSLVFSTDGTPVEWPSLDCGFGHVLTVDTPVGAAPPVIGLTLVPRAV